MKWKVAILEDDIFQLKDLKETLTALPNIDVVSWSTGSLEFVSKVEESRPDMIIVDINLNGDPSSGILVAHRLRLPVLFASANNAAYLKDIESLKRDHDVLVDHITKPIREEDLIKTINRFVRDLTLRRSLSLIWLKLGESRQKIEQQDIVYIGTDKNFGSESNNKVIGFKNREKEVLIDFSFVKMHEMGFDMNLFMQIHKSFVVNRQHIQSYDSRLKIVKVYVFTKNGNIELTSLPVSDNYKDRLKSFF
jgi:DNA-binding LytR/AlgR family response regulator